MIGKVDSCIALDNERPVDMADKVTVGELAERVNSHIKFFRTAVAFIVIAGAGWMGWLTKSVSDLQSGVSRVERAKADEPFRIIAGILEKRLSSRQDAASTLGAIPVILKTARVMHLKPDAEDIVRAGAEVVKAQDEYADLPDTWKASSAFINYKSSALVGLDVVPARNACHGALRRGSGWIFSDCEISLEEITANLQSEDGNGNSIPFVFESCTVRYSGGIIPAKYLVFVNSVLEFKVDRMPDTSGLLAMRQLSLSTKPVLRVTL